MGSIVVTGCGGSDFKNVEAVVVFGDSLSDLGTYRVGDVAASGGGRFTTNPGSLWIEQIAAFYQVPISAHRTAGFGTSETLLGGTGFAEGGARVALQPGIGCLDYDFTSKACGSSGGTTLPVRDQVEAFLANNDKFSPLQLVFFFAGADDILYQGQQVLNGLPVDAALAVIESAAADLAEQARKAFSDKAAKVVLINLPDLGATPLGTAVESLGGKSFLTLATKSFNQRLADELAASEKDLNGGKVEQIDLFAHFAEVLAMPARYGINVVDRPACRLDELPSRSALYCTASTLVASDADQTHLFADEVHPSTLGHRLIADFVRGIVSTRFPL